MRTVVSMLILALALTTASGFVQAGEPVPDFTAIPGGDCNGGSAVAPTTPPLVIHCPTEGGPKCKDNQKCRCTAVKNETSGVWESENTCS